VLEPVADSWQKSSGSFIIYGVAQVSHCFEPEQVSQVGRQPFKYGQCLKICLLVQIPVDNSKLPDGQGL